MRNREPSPTLKTPATIATATPRQAYGYLAVIIATWAGNWPMMRLALAHTEPMVFVSMRMAGSIAILAPILARCPVRCCRSGESGSPFFGSASSR
jgi:hypothetical protein